MTRYLLLICWKGVVPMLFVLAIGWQRLHYLLKTSKADRLEADRWLLGQIEAQANGWEAYLEGGDVAAAA